MANMSHEIRTPMNAIMGLSDIIMEESRGRKVFQAGRRKEKPVGGGDRAWAVHMHIPFVVYDGFFKACRTICNLIADNYEGGRMVGDYLRRMGHRRAMLVSDNDESVDRERMAGFREGFSDGQADFMKVPMNRAGRKLYYTQNMERIRSYTAAFAVSDVYAAEFMHFLLERGISVPGEISVVGFDDNALCENCFPRLTTVGQDAENRARMAMQALKRLWDESDGPTVEVLPVKLVIRDSVRRL